MIWKMARKERRAKTRYRKNEIRPQVPHQKLRIGVFSLEHDKELCLSVDRKEERERMHKFVTNYRINVALAYVISSFLAVQ